MSTQTFGQTRSLFMWYALVFVFFLLLIVCFFSKTTSFLGANFYHNHLLDNLFVYSTYLGDGLFAMGIVIVFLVLRKWAIAVKLFLSFILSGLTAQVLKKMSHMPRPKAFFVEHSYPYTHFITGVTHS